MRNASSSWACDPLILRYVPKTQKPLGPNGVPKSRPVVGAARGLTTALGELLSDMMESMTRTVDDSIDA